MASKAYYKKQLSVVNKKNNVAKNIDAITIVFNTMDSCVVVDNRNKKTAVLEGNDVAYFKKRLERVFKDCLIFVDSAEYE